MLVIACIDKRKGMMFNHRRQSRDSVVSVDILRECNGKALHISIYSRTLFQNVDEVELKIVKDLSEQIPSDGICFVEDAEIFRQEERIDKIILYHWNCCYPADIYFPLDLSGKDWELVRKEEFKGTSHEKIKKEVYCRRREEERMNTHKRIRRLLSALLCCVLLTSCKGTEVNILFESEAMMVSPEEVPEYSGEPYIVLNNNEPDFSEEDLTEETFETYSELDELDRCGAAYANICMELMPTEERESISRVKPSGWHTVEYDNVDGKYLYNHCHLMGFQLVGENANKKNLITGTRYMNVEGMLPFENMVADYVKETQGHVLYRVTPIFEDENLVASGVQMEAMSVEDQGESILFHVYVYNVQPGITIDYKTGESTLDEQADVQAETEGEIRGNKRSEIYHCPGQDAYEEMASSKYLVIFQTEQEAMDAGYRKAKR